MGTLLGLIFMVILIINFFWKDSVTHSSNPIQIKPAQGVPSNRLIDKNILRYKNNWIIDQKKILYDYKDLMVLVDKVKVKNIRYGDLLNCFEWQYKRFEILFRDKFTCVDCGEVSYSLHVHHKFYLVNRLPWEIEDAGLVSLCRSCHGQRHMNESIKFYNLVNNIRIESNVFFLRYCSRCNGTGYLPQFIHVQDGICFLCWGLNTNRTVFSDRIEYFINNPLTYNPNDSLDKSLNFFENITYDYFKNNIFNKLHTVDDDLPF